MQLFILDACTVCCVLCITKQNINFDNLRISDIVPAIPFHGLHWDHSSCCRTSAHFHSLDAPKGCKNQRVSSISILILTKHLQYASIHRSHTFQFFKYPQVHIRRKTISILRSKETKSMHPGHQKQCIWSLLSSKSNGSTLTHTHTKSRHSMRPPTEKEKIWIKREKVNHQSRLK